MENQGVIAIHFLDSSAVVKYYVTEPGSTWIRRLVDSDELLFLAQITIPEVAAALGILERRKHISRRHRKSLWERFVRDSTKRYRFTPVVYNVLYSAALLCISHPLKAYDAVQLAVGLAIQRTLTPQNVSCCLISGDDVLITAAWAEGLTVDNPFWHTDLDS